MRIVIRNLEIEISLEELKALQNEKATAIDKENVPSNETPPLKEETETPKIKMGFN